ncbi:MAG TPA: M1 family aminopeptidase [Bacteroidota bacterium]|nr:M1 family aminopeptidase [Bacteroidota bacterium]
MRSQLFILIFLLLVSVRPALPQDTHQPLPPGIESSCAMRPLTGASPLGTYSAFSDSRIDITYYKLNLRLDPSSSLLKGIVTVGALSLSDTLGMFMLDLSGGMKVDSVKMGLQRLAIDQFLAGIRIHLDRQYRKGEFFSVDVYYGGDPQPTGFGSFEFNSQNGVPWVWSLSEPYGAPDWWPCKNDNTDKADSADIWVTVPSGLKVGSNGLLVAVNDNGDGTNTYEWSERYPIAAYLISIAVSNYAVFTDWYRYSPTDSMQILNYVLPQDLQGAIPTLLEVKDMLRIFSGLYGPYPFIKEKYGHSEFGWGGAMEHQTMTSTTNFVENTLAHELSHQWFGDMISCATWPNLWLNEGFAVYSEALFLEKYRGTSAYWTHMNGFKTNAFNATGSLYVQDTTTVANLFAYNRVYAKGAWTLHMLRHVLGDSVFFRSIRTYADDARFRFKSATSDGLRSVFEAVSGKDLGYFFNEWIYGEGYPIYSYNWNETPGQHGYNTTLILSETGSGGITPFFSMPVDVRIFSGSWDTTTSVFHASSGQSFVFNTTRMPTDLQIDPDGWILDYVLSPSTILPSSYRLEQNYPNPFNPGTTIAFSLPHRSSVTLAVYDALGREVVQILSGTMEAGSHSVRWEGIDGAGRRVGSGTYFCRLTTETWTSTVKMLMLR